MAWDYKFNPETHDTIPDGKGSIERTQAADTMVMHQLAIIFAAWWGAPHLGSLLARLAQMANASEKAVQAEAVRALGVVEARGRITAIRAEAAFDPTVVGRISLRTEFHDTRIGRKVEV